MWVTDIQIACRQKRQMHMHTYTCSVNMFACVGTCVIAFHTHMHMYTCTHTHTQQTGKQADKHADKHTQLHADSQHASAILSHFYQPHPSIQTAMEQFMMWIVQTCSLNMELCTTASMLMVLQCWSAVQLLQCSSGRIWWCPTWCSETCWCIWLNAGFCVELYTKGI